MTNRNRPASATSQRVIDDVVRERIRAHAKHGDKSMESCSPTAERRLRILLEEVGEVAKEFNDAECEDREINLAKLRAELVQVTAMSMAWADALGEAGA